MPGPCSIPLRNLPVTIKPLMPWPAPASSLPTWSGSLKPMPILSRSSNLNIFFHRHQSPTNCLTLETLLLSGPPAGDQVLPLSGGPRLWFPYNFALGTQLAASLSGLPSPVRLGPLLGRPSPHHPAAEPSLLPGRTRPRPRESPPSLHARHPGVLPHPAREVLSLSSIFPLAETSIQTPFLLPLLILFPHHRRAPSPYSAPSPNSLGLAARPLSQQSCSLGSSACGRLTSQSRPRVVLGAPPRCLLGSVVLKLQRPRVRPGFRTTTYPRDLVGPRDAIRMREARGRGGIRVQELSASGPTSDAGNCKSQVARRISRLSLPGLPHLSKID